MDNHYPLQSTALPTELSKDVQVYYSTHQNILWHASHSNGRKSAQKGVDNYI